MPWLGIVHGLSGISELLALEGLHGPLMMAVLLLALLLLIMLLSVDWPPISEPLLTSKCDALALLMIAEVVWSC